jgi:hypothetical protein
MMLEMASRRSVQLAVFLVAPILFQAVLLTAAWRRGIFGIDFEQTLLPAARKVASGESPYPAYGYPPLVAFGLAPLTVVPSPQVVLAVALLATVPLSLWWFGVRDWRCYGAAFLWAPVFSAVQTENVTLGLLLGVAYCWHARDRWASASVGAGLSIAAKILCWPIVVWLGATRRLRGAAGSLAVAALVTLALWATLGFSGLLDYPASLHGLGERVAPESYTLKALAVDIGLSQAVGRALGLTLAIVVVVAVFVLARRGDQRRSFALAIVSMIVASPIVWLHSFALLLGAVAVLRPGISIEWLLPASLVVASGTGNGTPWQTATVLVVSTLTVALALAPGRRRAPDASRSMREKADPARGSPSMLRPRASSAK